MKHLGYYAKLAFRNFFKNRQVSALNIFGLTVGLSVFLLLTSLVRQELSYDKFVPDADRVYRIITTAKVPGGKELVVPIMYGKAAMGLTERFPQLETVAILEQCYMPTITIKNGTKFTDLSLYYTDTSFLKIFPLHVIEGDIKQALSSPNGIAITESTAQKFFGTVAALNQPITYGNSNLTVMAVYKDFPKNSSLQMDGLISINTIPNKDSYFDNRGLSTPVYLKFKTKPDTSLLRVMGQEIWKLEAPKFAAMGVNGVHSFQPLLKIHLNSSNISYDNAANKSSKRTVGVIAAIALLLLIISILNYVNLMTAKATKRALEIGLRKLSGAKPHELLFQNIFDAILVTFVALVCSFAVAELLQSWVETRLNQYIGFSSFSAFSAAIFVILWFMVSILSGFYPAMVMNRFPILKTLKMGSQKVTPKGKFHSALVYIQLTISILLISSLMAVYAQNQYLSKKDLGFDFRDVVAVSTFDKPYTTLATIREELQKTPGIVMVSGAESIPGNQSTTQMARKESDPLESSILIQENRVMDGYLETMKIKVVEGRSFREGSAEDSSATIINEAAVHSLGLTNPIGSTILLNNKPIKIIGVCADYHSASLHDIIQPLMHTRKEKNFTFLVVQLAPDKHKEGLEAIKTTLKKLYPDEPFTISLLDSIMQKYYTKEQRYEKLIFISSLLAIAISLLGLYTLTVFTTSLRYREIGIRKTLGANPMQIVALLGLNTNKLVLLASLTAWPIAWYVLHSYLNNFAYHIGFPYLALILASLLVLALANITAGVNTFKAANSDPAKTLKDE